MSIPLADVLRQVDLRGGHVYQCQIGRFRVEVRVDEIADQVLPARLDASDVMLDPWVDLPLPQSSVVLSVLPGSAILPDVPEFPAD